MAMAKHELNYDPQDLPREFKTHYISATEQDISEMLSTLGLDKLEDLFEHIPASIRMNQTPNVPHV